MNEKADDSGPAPEERAGAPDDRRIALLLPDLAEEELDHELRMLAMACRSALGSSRQADPQPDPRIQASLRAAVRAQRPAGRAAVVRHARVPISQAALGLAATLFVSLVPNQLVPAAGQMPLDLLSACQVAHARIDAYAGLDRLTSIGDRKLGAGRAEGASQSRPDSTPLPADST